MCDTAIIIKGDREFYVGTCGELSRATLIPVAKLPRIIYPDEFYPDGVVPEGWEFCEFTADECLCHVDFYEIAKTHAYHIERNEHWENVLTGRPLCDDKYLAWLAER